MEKSKRLSRDQAGIPRIILGSSSPRRRELLGHIAIHEAFSPDVEEKPKYAEKPDAYTIRNATEKAAATVAFVTDSGNPAKNAGAAVIIACDTIVVLDGQILEKPLDALDARRMLGQLSGRTHTVISGVCIVALDGTKAMRDKTFKVETQVSIKSLTPSEIAAYVDTGEPMDKAGSYGAQGIGAYMIERIDGSYSNVVGLPLTELVQTLRDEFGVHLW